MGNILVSVVIPTKDRPHLLMEAVESAVAQDIDEPVEVLVVGEEGAGDTERLLRQRFPDVRYIPLPPSGPAVKRQAGSDQARGEFLTYLDDDDVFLREKLRTQVQFLSQHPELDICFSDSQPWDGRETIGSPRHELFPQLWDACPERIAEAPPGYRFARGSLYRTFLLGLSMFPQSIMVRKDYLKTMGGWDRDITGCGECHDFSLRATYQGPIGYQDRVLFLLRRGHGSHMTNAVLRTYHEEASTVARVADAYPDDLREAISPILQEYLAFQGWRQYNGGCFEQAEQLYGLAMRYGSRSPRIMAKRLLSLARAWKARQVRGV